jgi:hypothetical protein
MSACEKCWADAYYMMRLCGGLQSDHYHRLVQDRHDNPCTPEQQAGQWWDDEKRRDRRTEQP